MINNNKKKYREFYKKLSKILTEIILKYQIGYFENENKII